jgi:6-phospho-beta-glucosidase
VRGETYFAAETGQGHVSATPDSAQLEALADEGYAGVALNVMEALLGHAPQILTLNVANQGAVSGMRDEDVVEVPCWVSRHLIRPLAMGALPDSALGLMKQIKAYERLTIEAALEQSYAKALAALSLHPLVPSYNTAQAILDDYITQHGALLPISRP